MKKICILMTCILTCLCLSSCGQGKKDPNYAIAENVLRTDAIVCLNEWLETEDYIPAGAELEQLLIEAKDNFGEDHRIVRVMQYALNAMYPEQENPEIVSMAAAFIKSDVYSLTIAFVDDFSCAYLEDDENPNEIVQVYDLVSGHYGIYDPAIREYVLEPVYTYLADYGEDLVCVSKDGYYGIYNLVTREYVLEPEYTYLSDCGENLICACKNGYYGCIDQHGNKVIGFMYDEPIEFINGIAIIKTNGYYGVINTDGTDILATKYGNILINPSVIVANTRTEEIGESEYAEFALFDYDGNQRSAHDYCSFKFYEDRIYAEYRKDGDLKLDHEYDETWYDLYDSFGNRLIGEGTTLPEVWGVKMPDAQGNMIAICDGEITNEYGLKYPYYPGLVGAYYGMRYITEDLHYLNYNAYTSYIKSFNSKGYAIATVYDRSNRENIRVIVDTNGNQIDSFILDDGNRYLPVDVNDYVYKMSHYTPVSGIIQYAVCNRVTRELSLYPSVQMVDGTNLTIVQDDGTGLYGLYDGSDLVLDLVYNEISYSEGVITAIRGAEETIYTATK